eukprot:1518428-Pleurochrysis_carterae.AAC.1
MASRTRGHVHRGCDLVRGSKLERCLPTRNRLETALASTYPPIDVPLSPLPARVHSSLPSSINVPRLTTRDWRFVSLR